MMYTVGCGVWGVQLLDAEQCQEKLRFARRPMQSSIRS